MCGVSYGMIIELSAQSAGALTAKPTRGAPSSRGIKLAHADALAAVLAHVQVQPRICTEGNLL